VPVTVGKGIDLAVPMAAAEVGDEGSSMGTAPFLYSIKSFEHALHAGDTRIGKIH